MADREKAIRDIKDLYGLDTDCGRQLLAQTVEAMGFGSLSDDALEHLAALHREEDFASCRRAEAKARRDARNY